MFDESVDRPVSFCFVTGELVGLLTGRSKVEHSTALDILIARLFLYP